MEPREDDADRKHGAADDENETCSARYGTAPNCGNNSLHTNAATQTQTGEATIEPFNVFAARST